MKILHKGIFNTPKVYKDNGKYYAENHISKREIPQQCCLTCKHASMYNNYEDNQCPYAKLGYDDEIICKDNIHDIDNGWDKFIESGLTENEYIKHSHWELYR